MRLGRVDVLIRDDASVLALEFVYRSDDITVWLVHRTLAVMDREHFAAWLRGSHDLVIDDLVWSATGQARNLTIDGHRTYVLNEATLAELANHA